MSKPSSTDLRSAMTTTLSLDVRCALLKRAMALLRKHPTPVSEVWHLISESFEVVVLARDASDPIVYVITIVDDRAAIFVPGR